MTGELYISPLCPLTAPVEDTLAQAGEAGGDKVSLGPPKTCVGEACYRGLRPIVRGPFWLHDALHP